MEFTVCDHHYIDGRWVAPLTPQDSIAVINPATQMTIGRVVSGGADDIDLAVAAARTAFPAFSTCPVRDRAALLERILALLEERSEEMAQAITREMGAAITFSRASQVPFGIAHIRAAIEVLETYPFIRQRGTTATIKEAIGVCGLITPWNWPLYQITAKVAPAIAAGCTIVLKPSEASPFSAQLFAQIMHDAGTPAGVFNLVHGTGPQVGAALAAHPDVDMISITGSTRAGVLVAQAAAPTVKRVTQELGGKSPNILLDDADFDRVVPLGVASAFRNVGQSCSAPTRMLVPASRLAQVEELAATAAAGMVVGDPLQEGTTLGPVSTQAQFDKVQAMIAIGMAEGALLVCGGPGRPAGLERGFFVRPTIFSQVRSTMRIAQEEIFGPVLCLIPYVDEAEAIRIANDTVYGLGSHIQSADRDRARRVARHIRAGQVHINHPAWDAHAAFGGYKQSGNGREYGEFGMEEYLETKAILGYFPQ
ncbi:MULTISPECIES: aldehyde dehydrogenase family protein [unclassified Azospirillum]|uniref:aldehyde dehydrogenase family protein n=1 Tax=unclassified Azospirillum TaxID=2630922 RepID=UPI000B6E3494|nr:MULTISPECIES: aldehyde dehydrogenase family protein [unclassified Azospirillum]SNS15735.1 aldehyde dehydrogenase (NAD+) [Azospirillum sp. RU38E]SNS33020.1 aldehyde dehydrogenase (NAD+) [Azospirillum sp. RU37A]